MEYDVTMPFIRMMCGPIDYTPGAMRNATKKDFQPIYYNPMSQGTRCHQLGVREHAVISWLRISFMIHL